MKRHLVFVYGTLKFGHSNHDLLSSSDFLGAHQTVPEFTMIDLGDYPGINGNGDTAILGEVYAVDDEVLRTLDQLEGYPELYKRMPIQTAHGDAWIYIFNKKGSFPIVDSGIWSL